MDDYRRLKKIIKKKVRRFLKKPAWQFRLYVEDPRGLQGRRWNLSEILKALLLGGIWRGDYDAVPGYCLKSNTSNGEPYRNLRVLRAVLTSVSSRVCLYQEPIPSDTNDMGAFEKFFINLERELGIMYEVVTLDSGFTSEHNAYLTDKG